MSKQTYTAFIRIAKNREIHEIFSRGTYLPMGPLRVRFITSNLPTSRFMVSVKKNVGNAPMRNRIKRLLRESLRNQLNQLEQSHDICLFVTQTPKQPLQYNYTYRIVSKLIEKLNKRTNLSSNKLIGEAFS